MHTSIALNTPIEFINVTPLNPYISKCHIKVCYVSDKPNRNGTIITKEFATELANSLPGSPIVGFYNEHTEDFEEHNRIIDVSNGKFEIKDTTRPYGFVDLGAKVWFQKFLDDGMNEREYLVTEGYIWTGQYPEAQRILKMGNNQSMELEEVSGEWTEDKNGYSEFFIINEAIISKLCILGEANEPCFEGASVQAPTLLFSFGDNFKDELFFMMNEIKELLSKGGKKVFNKYNVEIGDNLWNALYNHTKDQYSIEAVCEEENQIFAVLKAEDLYYRLNITIAEDEITFAENVEVLENFEPFEEAQFSLEAIQEFSEKNSDKINQEENIEIKYTLEEIPEYIELLNNYNTLMEQYNSLVREKENLEQIQCGLEADKVALNAELDGLKQFKLAAERKEKEEMINQFFMLTEDDIADVKANIDTYSLDEIESKLSVICVRNKVSFNNPSEETAPTTYNVHTEEIDNGMPAWVKVALEAQKRMN